MAISTKRTVRKIIAGVIALGVISLKVECNAEKSPKDVCMTPGCTRAASRILAKIDPKVDPCDNFYKFACGKFLNSTVIPDSKTQIMSFTIIDDKVQEQLRILLEGKSQPNEPKPFQMTKNFYKACINTALIEQKGLKPLLDRLELLGGWPVLDGDKWQDKDFDWKQAVYKARDLGYSVQYFFEFNVQKDLKDNSKYVLSIDQVPLTLNREYLVKGFSDKIVDAYYRYMVDTAVLLGANKARAEEELKESLDFEMKLANISIPKEERRDPTKLYNPMSIKQLSENYKSIPWKEYINKIVKPDKEIGDDEIVNVHAPSYFKEFEKLINLTPKKTVANYALWRAVHDSIDYLPDGIRKRQMQYFTIRSGQTVRKPRWQECLDFTSGSLVLSVGALYVRKYFTKETKKNALDMVLDIHQEFENILKTVDWIDEDTRLKAIDKAKSMVNHVGYPDELLDDKKLDEFYGKLETKENDYFQSNLNINIFQLEENWSRLRKPVNNTSWVDHGYSAVVDAFYSPNENSINLPAGILQDEYFDKDYPKYINYGAIGQIIGHETTHGFDDQGRQFDKNGNMIDWWKQETKEKFLSKAQCIIQQYGNYTVEEVGLKLNGVNTQGENIADNGGVKISYLAYQEWVKKHGTEPKLPNLNYSPSQLFWISAGNLWCSKIRPETLKSSVILDTHCPSEFRVIGPFSNRLEFATDFNCPVGSKMNPGKKCSVW